MERYLKERYPGVRRVHIVYRNLRPDVMALLTQDALRILHPAFIFVGVFSPFSTEIQKQLAVDVYKWMKKRFRRIMRAEEIERKADKMSIPICSKCGAAARYQTPLTGTDATPLYEYRCGKHTGSGFSLIPGIRNRVPTRRRLRKTSRSSGRRS